MGIENILRKQASYEPSMHATKKSREHLLLNSHQLSAKEIINQQEMLSFDELVLESNEIDLGRLQQESDFVERRFP